MTTVRQKRILITGAGRGLGRELACRFAAVEAEVIVADRDEVGLNEAVQIIRNGGGTAFRYAMDVTAVNDLRAVRERLHGGTRSHRYCREQHRRLIRRARLRSVADEPHPLSCYKVCSRVVVAKG